MGGVLAAGEQALGDSILNYRHQFGGV